MTNYLIGLTHRTYRSHIQTEFQIIPKINTYIHMFLTELYKYNIINRLWNSFDIETHSAIEK